MAGMGRSDQLLLLHRGVLVGETAAHEEAAEVLLRYCRPLLRHQKPGADEAILNDALEDAVIYYLQHPSTYDASRAQLTTFIVSCAANRACRFQRREAHYRCLLARQVGQLAVCEPTPLDCSTLSPEARLRALINNVAKSEQERKFLEARAHGERHTGVLAGLLGCSTLPLQRQRVVVKRTADRLFARLRRRARATVSEREPA